MAVEVVLIQQLTLLVGSSAYALVTVLATLLVASGLGSRCSLRFARAVPFLAILGWLALDIVLFPALVRALTFASPGARSVAAVLVVLPLGFFMGMPFPKATARVREQIDWGFAINGVGSVAGSTGVALIATEAGFRVALTVGGAFYALAMLLLLASHGWTDGPRPVVGSGDGAPVHS